MQGLESAFPTFTTSADGASDLWLAAEDVLQADSQNDSETEKNHASHLAQEGWLGDPKAGTLFAFARLAALRVSCPASAAR